MRALLTGARGPAGKALLPQLAQHNIEVVGVDMVGDENILEVPAATDPHFFHVISHMIDSFGIDLVIPTVQEELPIFARKRFRVPVLVSSKASVECAADKWLTYHALSKNNIPVPRSATPDILDTVTLEWLGHPIISKPRVSRGGRGVVIHEWPQVEELIDYPSNTIFQEFAPGIEYAPNVFIGEDPTMDRCVVLKKTELEHGLHGNAVATVIVDEPEIHDLAVRAVRALGLVGPNDVDIRVRADGTPVVLEINARFGANSLMAPEILEAVLRQYAEVIDQ